MSGESSKLVEHAEMEGAGDGKGIDRHIEYRNGDALDIAAFRCILTKQLMEEPVILSDGYSYEREAVLAHLRDGNITSPKTGEPLENVDMCVPNHTLADAIKELTRLGAAPRAR